jgi:DNA-binding beta-propeller fold protein YncE
MNKFKLTILTILFASLLIFSGALNAAAAGRLYVVAVCRDANAVEILDGETLKSLARIPVGEAPHEAIVSSDGRTAYVTNYGTKEKAGNSLSVIDLKALKETKRVDLGDLNRPHGLREVTGKIYFTAEAVKSAARFDPLSGKLIGGRKPIRWFRICSPSARTENGFTPPICFRAASRRLTPAARKRK